MGTIQHRPDWTGQKYASTEDPLGGLLPQHHEVVDNVLQEKRGDMYLYLHTELGFEHKENFAD